MATNLGRESQVWRVSKTVYDRAREGIRNTRSQDFERRNCRAITGKFSVRRGERGKEERGRCVEIGLGEQGDVAGRRERGN